MPLRTGSTDCADVGCGVSDLGLDLCRAHGLGSLWLLDASGVCIEQLRARYAAVDDLRIVASGALPPSAVCQEHTTTPYMVHRHNTRFQALLFKSVPI